MEECTICYKSHPKSFMKIHMQMKHLNGGRFYCKFCDCSFKQEALLEKHTKIHTGYLVTFFLQNSFCLSVQFENETTVLKNIEFAVIFKNVILLNKKNYSNYSYRERKSIYTYIYIRG